MVWDAANQICIISDDYCAVDVNENCPGDLNHDGIIGTSDLLELLSVYASTCPEDADHGPCAGESHIWYQGHTYPLVEIGNMCWFGENLQSRYYLNGDSIPGHFSNAEWIALATGAQAVYSSNPDFLQSFGRLYNWHAVHDSRGICPSGWHVPSNLEWFELEVHLGMDPVGVYTSGWRGTDEGNQLKASAVDWIAWDGVNSYEFNLVPGGYRSYLGGGEYYESGVRAMLWTSAESIPGKAWSRGFMTGQGGISREYSSKQLGFSVRCLKSE
jgi:uncharacterized protein (TIGR02145 family)